MKKIVSRSEKETKDFGARLGRQCRGGEIFALSGELGSGKTRFAQGLAVGLKIKSRVNSPTFNIMKIYQVSGRGPIKNFCHIDVYRLSPKSNLTAIGWEEFLGDKSTVCVVEWAERIKKNLPATKINKIIFKNLNEQERLIKLYES
jgi:tRNA threonylcarbamoyladenosine biosynthesis protein TsaE